MGANQSNNNIDFNKKIYIVIDLYLKPKFEENQSFDIENLKTNSFLKKNVKDIIVNSLINKYNRNVILLENNILLISKTDKNNIKYLEMNAAIEFSGLLEPNVKTCIIPTSTPTYINPNEFLFSSLPDVTIDIIKMNVLNRLYEYVSNKFGIITPDITLIIEHQTLYNIEIYQK
jgi:hypothetical protein